MKWFRIKNQLKGTYDPYCEGCCNPNHKRPITMGLVGAFIGSVIGLNIMKGVLNE